MELCTINRKTFLIEIYACLRPNILALISPGFAQIRKFTSRICKLCVFLLSDDLFHAAVVF